MRSLPQELNEIIVAHVAKHDDYIAREDLRSLRLVNKAFSHLATVSLFTTVPFWLGLKSLEHLTLISEHAQISQYVTKLVFSPIRFVKWKDPYAYQISVKKRLERDTFSHNTFALAFGKHVAAYKGYLEAQNYLSKNEQDLQILIRALRRLPHMKDVTIVVQDEIIGAKEIMSAFGLLNGNEVTLDAEYTLPILVRALIESKRQPEVLNFRSDMSRSDIELFDDSRQGLCYRLQTRFEYASKSPNTVTATAFQEAFLGDDDPPRRIEVITLVPRLRQFSLVLHSFKRGDALALRLLGDALEPITALASHLDKLVVCVSGNCVPTRYNPLLQLESFFHGSICFKRLQHLVLDRVESTAPLLIKLIARNSDSLIHVCLHYMRITGDGSWSDVLGKLRARGLMALQSFWLVRCEGAKGVIAVQDYVKCITSTDPVVASNDQDDSD